MFTPMISTSTPIQYRNSPIARCSSESKSFSLQKLIATGRPTCATVNTTSAAVRSWARRPRSEVQ